MADCERCNHSPHKHRCDDSKNYDLADPATPFRCVVDGCECADFIGDALAATPDKSGKAEQ